MLRSLVLRYTIKSLMIAASAIASWFAYVAQGTRAAGTSGGVIAAISMGLGIAFIVGAIRSIRTRGYIAMAAFLFACFTTIATGYFTLKFNSIFASPELTLTRNFQRLGDQLRHDNAFTNLDARIHREAIGGCVVLTGIVDSKDDLTRLETICLTFGQNAIWNRVRVAEDAK